MQAVDLRLLAKPEAGGVSAADPAEVVLSEPVQRSVVDHAAMLVAHGAVDHLADSQSAVCPVSGKAAANCSASRSQYLEFAECRKVHEAGPGAHRPVFFEGAAVQ